MSCFGLLLAMLLALDPALAESARTLARKIAAALTAREPVELSLRNASSLGEREVSEVRDAIQNELRPRLAPGDSPAAVGVTLSENSEGFLWVADIRHGGKRDVVMMMLPPPAAAAQAGRLLMLDKKPLWEQETAILDVSVAGDSLAVLDSGGLSVYRDGQRQAAVPIVPSKPWPRDLRGRLEVQGDAFRADLPGMTCNGSLRPELHAECKEDPAANIAPGRNFFSEPGQPPFYSKAFDVMVPVDGAGNGWGTDIAAVVTPCGNYVLATRPTDANETDAVQAFSVQDRRPVEASAAVEFLGPVTALWRTDDRSGAVAVARNLKTGRYAAYSLSLACGH